MADPYSKAEMQKAFDALKVEIDTIESSSPRLERDEKYAILTEAEKKDFQARINAHEVGLFDLKVRYANLARAIKTAK